MINIWSVKGLCRCCHCEGSFKSLSMSDNTIGVVFPVMIRETFEINIVPLPGDVGANTYSICSICEGRLQDAALFKKQVADCEEKLAKYYSKCEAFTRDVKLEETDPREKDKLNKCNKMIDIQSVKGLCRCCHSEGKFKSLSVSDNTIEVELPIIIRETFKINIVNLPGDVGANTNSICSICETRLQEAALFKKQVVACEEKFAKYYSEFEALTKDVKLEKPDPLQSPEAETYLTEEGTDIKHYDDAKSFFKDVKSEENDSSESRDAVTPVEETDVKFNKVEIYIEPELEDQPLLVVRRSRRKNTDSDEKETDDQHSDTGGSQKNKTQKDESRKFICDICQKKYTYKGSLEYHMEIHTGVRTCQLCNSRIEDLNKHFKENHYIDKKYVCSVCNRTYGNMELFKKHLKYHLYERVKCTYCTKKYLKRNLKEHLKLHTGQEIHACKMCNKSFLYARSLKYHMAIHTGDRPWGKTYYICDDCGRRFSVKNDLERHITTKHIGIKPHSCKVCNRQFSYASALAKHEWTHTGQRPYSCGVCNKQFAHKTYLKNHEIRHTGERIECKVCNKGITYSNMKKHMRLHAVVKAYKCSFCDKQFNRSELLKGHERTHTGEKPSCEICKKSFTESSYLTVHMRIHTGEKPYACDICERRFRYMGDQKRHVTLVHTCKICNQLFSVPDLKLHKRSHEVKKEKRVKKA